MARANVPYYGSFCKMFRDEWRHSYLLLNRDGWAAGRRGVRYTMRRAAVNYAIARGWWTDPRGYSELLDREYKEIHGHG